MTTCAEHLAVQLAYQHILLCGLLCWVAACRLLCLWWETKLFEGLISVAKQQRNAASLNTHVDFSFLRQGQAKDTCSFGVHVACPRTLPAAREPHDSLHGNQTS
jgi:hypothetical protein